MQKIYLFGQKAPFFKRLPCYFLGHHFKNIVHQSFRKGQLVCLRCRLLDKRY